MLCVYTTPALLSVSQGRRKQIRDGAAMGVAIGGHGLTSAVYMIDDHLVTASHSPAAICLPGHFTASYAGW